MSPLNDLEKIYSNLHKTLYELIEKIFEDEFIDSEQKKEIIERFEIIVKEINLLHKKLNSKKE